VRRVFWAGPPGDASAGRAPLAGAAAAGNNSPVAPAPGPTAMRTLTGLVTFSGLPSALAAALRLAPGPTDGGPPPPPPRPPRPPPRPGPRRPEGVLDKDRPAGRLLPPRHRPGLPGDVRQRPERPRPGDLRRHAAQDLRPGAARRGPHPRLPAGAAAARRRLRQ